jgi:hypothetical protein
VRFRPAILLQAAAGPGGWWRDVDPAIDAALGFDKLGLPYYVPGWQQPSACSIS